MSHHFIYSILFWTLSSSQSFQNNLKICHRIMMTSRQNHTQLNQKDLAQTGTIKPSAVGGASHVGGCEAFLVLCRHSSILLSSRHRSTKQDRNKFKESWKKCEEKWSEVIKREMATVKVRKTGKRGYHHIVNGTLFWWLNWFILCLYHRLSQSEWAQAYKGEEESKKKMADR